MKIANYKNYTNWIQVFITCGHLIYFKWFLPTWKLFFLAVGFYLLILVWKRVGVNFARLYLVTSKLKSFWNILSFIGCLSLNACLLGIGSVAWWILFLWVQNPVFNLEALILVQDTPTQPYLRGYKFLALWLVVSVIIILLIEIYRHKTVEFKLKAFINWLAICSIPFFNYNFICYVIVSFRLQPVPEFICLFGEIVHYIFFFVAYCFFFFWVVIRVKYASEWTLYYGYLFSFTLFGLIIIFFYTYLSWLDILPYDSFKSNWHRQFETWTFQYPK